MCQKKKKEETKMKILKKIAILMLAVCLIIPCFSFVSFAADGKIMFTDPSCKTGETVEVKVVVERTATGSLGKIDITMTYDTTMLKFNSGNGVTESQAGTLTYQGDATRDVGTRKEFVLKFDSIKAGTAEIKIQDATIKNVSGTVMNYSKGASKVTIAQGEGTVAPSTSTDAVVDVDGQDYRFADQVPENEVPEGYATTTLNYDLNDYNVVYNETTGLYLAYLVNDSNIGKLFMYVEENATFVPYESIKVSNDVTITLLTDVTDVVLPNDYEETEVLVNDFAFPAWQNSDEPEFCIVYAMNNNGVKSLYRMDNTEKTYQRFTAPEIVPEEKETWITKLSDVLVEHMDKVILGTGLGFLLFVLIIVILSVKLYNRNAELDITYEEYDEMKEKLARYKEDEDEEDEDYDTSSEEPSESTEGKEMEMLVQEGMKEVFPEEMMSEVLEEPEEEKETSLAEALEQQKTMVEEMETDEEIEEPKSEGTGLFEDDEILMEDFSVDFIDLEDDDE